MSNNSRVSGVQEHLREEIEKDAKVVEVGAGAHDTTNTPSAWMGAGIALELGFLIAIPALVMGFGGALLDREFDTSPIFLLLGFVISLSLSCYGVYRMMKRLAP